MKAVVVINGKCSIRPLPEMREFPISASALRQISEELGLSSDVARGYVMGWNDCIDEISGGSDESDTCD